MIEILPIEVVIFDPEVASSLSYVSLFFVYNQNIDRYIGIVVKVFAYLLEVRAASGSENRNSLFCFDFFVLVHAAKVAFFGRLKQGKQLEKAKNAWKKTFCKVFVTNRLKKESNHLRPDLLLEWRFFRSFASQFNS